MPETSTKYIDNTRRELINKHIDSLVSYTEIRKRYTVSKTFISRIKKKKQNGKSIYL